MASAHPLHSGRTGPLSREVTGWRNKLMSSITKGLVMEESVVNRPPSGGGRGRGLYKVIHHSKGVLHGGVGGAGTGPEGARPGAKAAEGAGARPRPREDGGSPGDPFRPQRPRRLGGGTGTKGPRTCVGSAVSRQGAGPGGGRGG